MANGKAVNLFWQRAKNWYVLLHVLVHNSKHISGLSIVGCVFFSLFYEIAANPHVKTICQQIDAITWFIGFAKMIIISMFRGSAALFRLSITIVLLILSQPSHIFMPYSGCCSSVRLLNNGKCAKSEGKKKKNLTKAHWKCIIQNAVFVLIS